ncbi:MAG TPA: glycoside hydrolase family 9 protein, partial [Prolixibacteraceae bacterium]
DWEKEAREAYDWAKANTKAGDETTKPAMGFLLKDIRGFAAASLYQLTGETKYHDQLKTDFSGISSTTFLSEEKRWGPFVYASMKNQPADAALQTKFVSAIKSTANAMVSTANLRACRFGGDFNMPMLVGQSTTPLVFEVIMGWSVFRESDQSLAKTYKTCIQNTADYFLGNNPLNTTWITGLGLRRPERVMHLDSWYNGKDEMAPGITPYGPWRYDSNSSGQGPWDMAWAFKSIYPTTITNWPGHERWFGNYTCPMNAEFTIHQNTIYNAIVYGFLCDKANGSFVANQRPVVNTMTVKKTNIGAATDDLIIEATVADTDADSRIYKVEFFDTWHKIGEAFEAPYQINWTCSGTRNFEITAKVYDQLGAIGKSTILKRANIITALNTPEKAEPQIRIYPNPTNGQINFQFQNVDNKTIQLTIFNSEGKLMTSFKPQKSIDNSSLLTWNPAKQSCAEGMYLYSTIISSGKDLKREEGKIVYHKNL